MEREFLGIGQVADLTGVSSKTVRRWLTQGLPFVQKGTGQKILVRRTDIYEFLTPRRAEGPRLDDLVAEVCGDLMGGHSR